MRDRINESLTAFRIPPRVVWSSPPALCSETSGYIQRKGLMREGAWINIKTGKFEWITEHCDWIKVHGNAQKIGLPEEVFEHFKDMPNDYTGP